MRALIQRTTKARVTINDETQGTFAESDVIPDNPTRSIETGFVIFLGVGKNDTASDAERLWNKIAKMRIFPDEVGKSNLSLHDVHGQVLIISQFTLYANCKRGNRPNFMDAGSPDMAKRLYVRFAELACEDEEITKVSLGEFGADMTVDVRNDGPFSVWLDTEEM